MTDDVQRALGRIEGTQVQILAMLKSVDDRFAEHVQADQVNFSSVRSLVYTQRDELKAQFSEQDRMRNSQFEAQAVARDAHLGEQDAKLDGLIAQRNVQKGVGIAIVSISGALLTIIGSSVLALVEGWIKLKH